MNEFAKRSAAELAKRGVPLFECAYPQDGKGTFRHAFWILAVDVEWADRFYVEHVLRLLEPRPGYGPPLREHEHEGHFRGEALLLTRTAILCHANLDGFLTGWPGLNDSRMDVRFSGVDRSISKLQSGDWGWWNQGRWRRNPKADITVFGLPTHTHNMMFEERYHRNGPLPDDGRSTSAALAAFVKSGGQVRWPRHFPGMDWE